MYKLFSLFILLFLNFYLAAQAEDDNQITTLNGLKINDIISDPQGNLYIATEYGGFYISTDKGNSWKLTNSLTKKYNITCILYDDYEGLFCSTRDGALIQSTDKGKTWRIRRGYEKYWGFPPTNSIISTKRKFKLLCTDGYYETSYDNHNIGPNGNLNPYRFYFDKEGSLYSLGRNVYRNDRIDDNLFENWIKTNDDIKYSSYCLAFDNDNRIFIGTEKGIYFSVNKGSNWELLSKEIENYSISSIHLCKNGRIIAGTDSNGIFLTDNKGINWTSIYLPFEKNRILKFLENGNNELLAITFNGLFKTKDNGIYWEEINSKLIDNTDSSHSSGWIPSVNFFDLATEMQSIYYLKIINNDSFVVVKDESNKFKFICLFNGNIEKEFNLSGLNVKFFDFIAKDSILLCIESDGNYNFGFYNIYTKSFDILFSISYDYFSKQLVGDFTSKYIHISNIIIDFNKKNVYLYYHLTGYKYPKLDSYQIDKFEMREFPGGSFKKFISNSCNFSDDFNFYINEYDKLYNDKDELILNLRQIPGNPDYIKTANFSKTKISPNNKYLFAYDKINKSYACFNFKNGKLINEIKTLSNYDPTWGVTYDDNYIVTASNESAIKIFYVNSAVGAIDSVIFWPGDSNWLFDITKRTNTIVFGGYDGVLRLWKPDMNLTGVEEMPEPEKAANIIYPNPAYDFVYIKEIGDRPTVYSVISLLGDTISQGVAENGRIEIGILPAGTYILKCHDYIYKFIKL